MGQSSSLRESGEESGCGNRISGANFVIAFHNNYGSILLYDHVMDNEQRTDANNAYLAHEAGQQSIGTNQEIRLPMKFGD